MNRWSSGGCIRSATWSSIHPFTEGCQIPPERCESFAGIVSRHTVELKIGNGSFQFLESGQDPLAQSGHVLKGTVDPRSQAPLPSEDQYSQWVEAGRTWVEAERHPTWFSETSALFRERENCKNLSQQEVRSRMHHILYDSIKLN